MGNEIRHGPGWTSDYFLCGLAPEEATTEGGRAEARAGRDAVRDHRQANAGEVVNCEHCVRLIDHVLGLFTDAHRVRRIGASNG